MSDVISPSTAPRRFRRVLIMSSIVISGEAIFILPFLVPRVFRPTVLDVFGLTNYDYGTALAVYGVVAMVSYFLGGPLADRFSLRLLMSLALSMTALGGIWLASIPSLFELKVLYGLWGLSTIFLFWAAMIRATREWGGVASQGMAFGILDGGRGLFAALLASISVVVFASMLPSDAASATLPQRTAALQQVIWIFTGFVVAAAVLVWFGVPPRTTSGTATRDERFSLRSAAGVVTNKAVWLQAIIVVCAYTGYKGIDDYGLFSRDAFGFNDVQAARLGTLALWIRPLAALGAGLLADRISGSRAVLFCFLGLFAGDLVIAFGWLIPSMSWSLYMTVVGTCAMVYGLRGVYFALFNQAQVPNALTGTATGLVSVVGYTPDVFMGPLMGYFTDTYPGAIGHQYLFGALSGFAAVGVVATLLFHRRPSCPAEVPELD